MEQVQVLQFVDLSHLPFAIAVVVIAAIVSRFVGNALDEFGERFSEHRLLFKQLSAFARFFILIGSAAVVVMSLIHLSKEVLLAIGGSMAVAVGFAFKDLLASLMAGLILLVDRPFQVGDRISFGGEYGEVREIGLRTVRIATLDDNLISVPNSRFLTEAVSCANAGALDQMCVIDFYIGANEDFDAAKAVVFEATATSNFVYLKKPILVNVREGPVAMGEHFAFHIQVKAYVFDGRFESRFATDVTERVHRAFRQREILTAGRSIARERTQMKQIMVETA